MINRFQAVFDTKQPLAVVSAATIDDVVTSVKWARQHGVCMSVKSSGHSFGGLAVLDGRLALDLGRMNATPTYSDTPSTLTCGPGVTTLQVVTAAREHGV